MDLLIYDNIIYSKLATLLMVGITCIGTRAKKTLEFNAQKMVIIPILSGIICVILSVFLYRHFISLILFRLPLNWILYMIVSIVGVILIHIALDNLSKIIKSGLARSL